MKQTATKRITEYDIAKGIGILLVVIGHALPVDTYWRVFIYSFHMPLFFVLSGLVMKDAEPQALKKSILDEKKLISSYIFYSGLYFLFDMVVRFLILRTISVNNLFWDIYQTVTLFGISVLWFLATLILGKIITNFIAARVKTDKKRVGIAIIIFAVGATAAYCMPSIESGAIRLIYYPIAMCVRTIMMSSFILLGYSIKNRIPALIKKVKILNTGGGYAQRQQYCCYCLQIIANQ